MHLIYQTLIPGLWLAWGIYWGAAAFGAKPVQRREAFASRLSHGVPLLIGIIFLAIPQSAPVTRILPFSPALFWIGAALTALGMGFSIAARSRLGGNWSATVTLKHGHTLTRDGPYRYVRHPIYSGLCLAVLGGAIALGEWRGFLALILIAGALRLKIRVEERFLSELFGGAYLTYRREVAALVPFLL